MTTTLVPREISSDLSLTRLHLMRAGYLVIGVGLALEVALALPGRHHPRGHPMAVRMAALRPRHRRSVAVIALRLLPQ
jgi:hypothetical protein